VGRTWLIQLIWLAVAAGLFVAAGLLTQPLQEHGQASDLVVLDNVVARSHPEMALLTTLPGGLRAPVVNYLWIRAERFKQDGRYFDAMQLADLICRLQPRFEGVWSFHAWNMAWNISVATHTPDERWLWVTNGMRLLRDRGIPYNPKSLRLYKDLAWIFMNKMGAYMDEMHFVYKRRWAGQMQRLLGAPPPGETPAVIDAFRPIAQAPLDKAPARQGKRPIQQDQLDLLLADPVTGEYAQRLQELGVEMGRGLLVAWNRYSRDEGAERVRLRSPRPENERQQAIYDAVNDPEAAEARGKLLAFVRAQLLWNVYKMDPAWMLSLMERFGIPMDWRQVWAHGLYWGTYGLYVCDDVPIETISSLNTDRIVLNSLQMLTWGGRLTYLENPDRPESPTVDWWADWRYIEATQQEYLDLINARIAVTKRPFEKSMLQAGHRNYLVAAIQMLYVQHRHQQARELLEWIKENYKMEGGLWDEDLDRFVVDSLSEDGAPIANLARNQIGTALQMAYYFLAKGNAEAYAGNVRYARKVYNAFQKSTEFERLKLARFEAVASSIAAPMVIEPWASGRYLSIVDRSQLYVSLPLTTQVLIYDRVANTGRFRRQVADAGLDFEKAFPVPPGIEEYRRWQQEVLRPAGT